MAEFFFFITFLNLILLIYGLFAPKKAVFWQSDPSKRTRKVVIKTYFWAMILSFFVFVGAIPKEESQQNQKTISKATASEQKKAGDEEKVEKQPKTEKRDIDSLDICIKNGDSAFYKNNFQDAMKNYEKSIKIKQNEYAYAKIAFIYSKQNLKTKTIEYLSEARKITNNDSIIIALAKAYYNNGQKPESLSEIKFLKQQGNKEASQLWDLYNPELTRVTGYITRCCDGSTSMATGRGACSHHGGVCNWNEPIYVKYREFE
ncbi:hypothetical protein AD998_01890 [bacterium 336/3]|nr:hypothetical protein AD998_01890 [bacterium 336/3]